MSSRISYTYTKHLHLFIESNDGGLCLDIGNIDFKDYGLPINWKYDSLQLPKKEWLILAKDIIKACDDWEITDPGAFDKDVTNE